MRPEFPRWVAAYVGIPYAPGRQDNDACDCWGLFNLVWRERMGAALPSYEGPLWEKGADRDAVGQAAEAYAALFSPVEAGQERLGDGVLFRMMGHPLHLGFVLAPGWMLHIEEGCDAVVENYTARAWDRRLIGLYRYTPQARAHV